MGRRIALHERQFLNAILREVGIRPAETYQSKLGPGDRIAALIVEEEPARIRRLEGRVLAVEEHGWYRDVAVQNGQPQPETIRLYRDGPPEWGVVEIQITELRHRPLRKPAVGD